MNEKTIELIEKAQDRLDTLMNGLFCAYGAEWLEKKEPRYNKALDKIHQLRMEWERRFQAEESWDLDGVIWPRCPNCFQDLVLEIVDMKRSEHASHCPNCKRNYIVRARYQVVKEFTRELS